MIALRNMLEDSQKRSTGLTPVGLMPKSKLNKTADLNIGHLSILEENYRMTIVCSVDCLLCNEATKCPSSVQHPMAIKKFLLCY